MSARLPVVRAVQQIVLQCGIVHEQNYLAIESFDAKAEHRHVYYKLAENKYNPE
jgi:hypothetical protein